MKIMIYFFKSVIVESTSHVPYLTSAEIFLLVSTIPLYIFCPQTPHDANSSVLDYCNILVFPLKWDALNPTKWQLYI